MGKRKIEMTSMKFREEWLTMLCEIRNTTVCSDLRIFGDDGMIEDQKKGEAGTYVHFMYIIHYTYNEITL